MSWFRKKGKYWYFVERINGKEKQYYIGDDEAVKRKLAQGNNNLLIWKKTDGDHKCICCCNCIASCPVNALKFVNDEGKEITSDNLKGLRRDKWGNRKLIWDKEKCTGCGLCVKVCPASMLKLLPKKK